MISGLSTWYIREGDTATLEIVGLRHGNDEAEPFWFTDGPALYLLVRVREADSDRPLLLKQFGAVDLMAAGLNPRLLDPGQVVEVHRFDDGGYSVDLDPGIDSLEEAM